MDLQKTGNFITELRKENGLPKKKWLKDLEHIEGQSQSGKQAEICQILM